MASTQPSFLTGRTHEYLDSLVVGETKSMLKVRQACEAEGLPAVSPQTGRLLATLTSVVGARRVLEVGCLYGYSALWLASASRDARVETVEVDDRNADVAEESFLSAGVADRILVHRGRALDVLPRLKAPYDLVFLDAAKAEYPTYLDHARRLLRPGGVLAADNVLWSGRVWDDSAEDDDTVGLRRFTEALIRDSRFATSVLPVGDGLSVSVYRP